MNQDVERYSSEGAPHLAGFGRCGLVLSLVLIFGALIFAQDLGNLGPAKTQPPRVTMAPIAPLAIRAGTSSHVELAFRVASGFHINSSKPHSDLLVPTTLKLNPPTDISIAKVTFPEGRDYSFDFAPSEKLNVYTGDFTVGAMVNAARSMPPGRYRVHGDLRYQACDNKLCYPPAQVPVAFDVQISKAASTKPARRNPRQSPHVHQ